jgi:hypothetical protein
MKGLIITLIVAVVEFLLIVLTVAEYNHLWSEYRILRAKYKRLIEDISMDEDDPENEIPQGGSKARYNDMDQNWKNKI